MEYIFKYFKNKEEKEKDILIEAENDKEAVFKFYDIIGIFEFGCIKENGYFFTDDDYKNIKIKIEKGC